MPAKLKVFKPGDVAFSEERAARAVDFTQELLVHTKGRWARRPFMLQPWQRDDIWRPLFGTVTLHDDPEVGWVRLYRQLWLELGRKNGKSEMLAALALILLVGDDEEEAEIYGAARDRDQAGLVFNVAARMVELSPHLSKRLKVIRSRKRIVDPRTSSVYQVISADAMGNLGQNPHGVIFDEIVAQPSRELYDALTTAEGTRTQSLVVCATTAGPDSAAFAALEQTEMGKVAEDPDRDPTTLVFKRNTELPATASTADLRALLEDEEKWAWANPAMRTAANPAGFLDPGALRRLARKARNDPTKLRSFLIFRLNMWLGSLVGWMPQTTWAKGGGMVLREQLIGRECIGGLDLAATTDLASLALLFPPAEGDSPLRKDAPLPFQALWHHWTPRANAEALNEKTAGAFEQWEASGLVTVTEGDVIDYDQVHADIERVAEDFNLVSLRVDRWNATQTISHLEQRGISAHTVGAGFGDFSPGMKELYRMVEGLELNHGGNPLVAWCMDAVVAEINAQEQIRPRKIKDRAASRVRIDAAVALIYAVGEWLRLLLEEEDQEPGFMSLEMGGPA